MASDLLERDGRDLVAAAHAGALEPAWHRDHEIGEAAALLSRGRSVLLTGTTGVGKSAVVRGIAGVLDRPLVQLSTTDVLAGTKYLGEWQSKVTALAQEAVARGAVLYFTDAWNLPSAGVTSQSETNLLDALRPFVADQGLVLLAEAGPEARRRMERVSGFLQLFQTVRVDPLDAEAVDGVIAGAAERLGVALDAESRRTLVQLTGRFLPRRPQPGPAIELLERARDYQVQKRGVGEEERVGPAFLEKVLAIYTGLPLFIVSPQATRSATEIRQWFRDRIVGQQEAIEAVVETIALFKAGLHDPGRPIGTFLFVGPTGVGKTEVARALATFLFGSPHRLLRFDLSELKDYHSFEALLGSPGDPTRPARLVDPVRAQPFQVVLLDELEKAHPNVWDLLLPLLDEGRLTTPSGQEVDFRSTLVVATSNVGAEEAEQALGFGTADPRARAERTRRGLQHQFRPELLNRFQHVVVFHHLSPDEVRTVARHELRRVLEREGITQRNLVVEVDDEALELVMRRGFDQRYGARALKREIQRQIVLPLALRLMEREVVAGQIIRVTGRDGRLRIRFLETAESRETRRESEPVRLEERRVARHELPGEVDATRARIEELARLADEPFLVLERDRLEELRREPAFWQHPEHAARTLRDLDRVGWVLDRLDRLRSRTDDLEEEAENAATRQSAQHAIHRLARLRSDVEAAFRELVYMGESGTWDALVEIAPIGPGGRQARDLLVTAYTRWAVSRRMEIAWLRVPRSDDEPAMLAIKGRYAHGMLQLEAGLHKVSEGDAHGAARVRVAPWTDRVTPVVFGEHQALKGVGHYGEKIRSRLECAGGLVLQNGRTLADNRDLAVEVAGSWREAPPPSDLVVRRYDLAQPLVRDVLTGFSSGRPDALEPDRFHQLLARRVDEAGTAGPETA